MRVLIVSPFLIGPGMRHAGGETMYRMADGLHQRGHDLHLLCYSQPGETNPPGAVFRTVTTVTPAWTWRQKVEQVLWRGWRRPWLMGRRTRHAMQDHIRRICHVYQIDVVHFAWTEMGVYLDAVPEGIGTVLHTHDVESLVRRREIALAMDRKKRRQLERRASRLIAIEKVALPRAGVVLACSEFDRQLIHQHRTGHVFVVSPYIDTRALSDIVSDDVVPGRLIFMGAMDRLANQAAVNWLIIEVLPRIQRAYPTAHLIIAGAHPPSDFLGGPGVTVTGYVEDLAELWRGCHVAVLPSLIGGGMLVKVMQALAAGRPVVTTTAGNEGVAAPEEAIMMADDPVEFAAAVIALLNDPVRCQQMSAAGRVHSRRIADWSATMLTLEEAYRTALTRHRRMD